jgi:hypothetical protein
MDINNHDNGKEGGEDRLNEVNPCEYLKEFRKKSRIRRALIFFKEFSWAFLLSFFIVAIVFGYWGFTIAFEGIGNSQGWDNILYYTLQLFVLQSGMEVIVNNIQLEIARFIAVIFTFSFLFYIFWLLFDHMRRILLSMCRGHIIICGLGYLGPAIARKYIGSKRVVIIEKDPHNQDLQIWKDEGAIIFQGDATREELLRKAHLERASDIFIVTGNDEINIEIAVKCTQVIEDINSKQSGFFPNFKVQWKKLKKKIQLFLVRKGLIAGIPNQDLHCHVHIVDRDLNDLLLQANLMGSSHNRPIKMDFFNLYQIAGCCILKQHPPFSKELALTSPPHILVVGMGRMGESVIVKSARKWKKYGKRDTKIKISCISNDTNVKEAYIRWKYPSLQNYCDLETIDMDIMDLSFKEGLFLDTLNKSGRVDIVYICLDNTSVGMTAALTLAQLPAFKGVKIVMRSTYCGSAVEIFREFSSRSGSPGIFSTIIPFPIIDNQCSLMYICGGLREMMARASHANYIERRTREGATPETDLAMKPWDELKDELKESTFSQIDHIYTKIHHAKCRIETKKDWDEPLFEFSESITEDLAEMEHERWCRERKNKGWIYAEKTDKETRRSQWMVPYDKLPPYMKEYDRDPVRRIPEYLEMVDLKVEPN